MAVAPPDPATNLRRTASAPSGCRRWRRSRPRSRGSCPARSPSTGTPRAVSTFAARNTTCRDPTRRDRQRHARAGPDRRSVRPRQRRSAQARRTARRAFASCTGDVPSSCGTSVRVWPPLRSSICEISFVGQARGLAAQRADRAGPAGARHADREARRRRRQRRAVVVAGLALSRRDHGLDAAEVDPQVGDVQAASGRGPPRCAATARRRRRPPAPGNPLKRATPDRLALARVVACPRLRASV